MKFNDILRDLRISRDMTQDDLAKALGRSKSAISMYENGNRVPDLETLEIIADYFNIDINRLTGCTTSDAHVLTPDEQEFLDTYIRGKGSKNPAVKALVKAIDKLLRTDEQENGGNE